MKYLIGIDLGSSAIKVGLFDTKGILHSIIRETYSLEFPRNGWVDIPVGRWWSILKNMVSNLVIKDNIQTKDIVGIGISNFCPSLVLIDKKRNILRPVINFMDQRSQKQLDNLKKIVDENEFCKITGNGLNLGSCSLINLLWVKENEPNIYHEIDYIGHLNTYICELMTKNIGIDYTNASMTGLFDTVNKQKWSKDLCDLFEISPDILPPLYRSGDKIGNLTKIAAAELNLKEGIPVAIGAADTACSALALNLQTEKEIFESAGTSDVLTFCLSSPKKLDKRFVNRLHIVPDFWLCHGSMSTSGATLKWLKNGLYKFEEIIMEEYKESVYSLMSEDASKALPGSGGVIFLPYMMGERTPIWDGDARGVFFGLSLSTTKQDIIRAIMEGNAFGLKQIIDIIESEFNICVSKIKAVGGCTESEISTQIKSDILNKTIMTMNMKETALTGAALLGGVAGGVFKDYQEAMECRSLETRYSKKPITENKKLYEELYQIYNGLYPLIKNEYKTLSNFRKKYYK